MKNVSDELKLWGEIEIEYGHKFDQIKSDSHQLGDLTSRKDYKYTKNDKWTSGEKILITKNKTKYFAFVRFLKFMELTLFFESSQKFISCTTWNKDHICIFRWTNYKNKEEL